MSDKELMLLENVLDALDRLFDGETRVIDLHALLVATSQALIGTEHFQVIDSTAGKMETILRSKFSDRDLRESALTETDDLRIYLAGQIPFFNRLDTL